MRFFTLICPALFFAAALLLSGCSSFEYTGRSFASYSDDEVIAWHTAKNPVPAGKYRVIGRGVLKFRTGSFDTYDVEERLIEEARKHGADAVKIEKSTVEGVGNYDIDNAPDPGAAKIERSKYGVTAKGEQLEINSFGSEVKLSGAEILSSESTVYAVFYKKSEAVQKLIESQPVRVADVKEIDK